MQENIIAVGTAGNEAFSHMLNCESQMIPSQMMSSALLYGWDVGNVSQVH